MAKMLLKVPAIRGTVTLSNDEGDGTEYEMTARGFEPLQFTAETLDEAIQKCFSSVGRMQRTQEWKQNQAIANDRRKQAAELKKQQQPKDKAKPSPVKQPA